MDPQNDLPDLVEDLEVNIDELTTTLAHLLNAQLTTTTSSLPLLDKAKLYVLAAYSIESLLYSTLQASGVNAKEHAIFKELARLKGYFGKIKRIEEHATTSAAPKAKLDVGAAARFIKHGLAGNEKYDLERAERQAKERARAHLKAQQINKKFDDDGVEKTPAPAKKRDIEDVVAAAPEADVQEEAPAPSPTEPASKKPKLSDTQPASARRSKRDKKKPKSAGTSDAEIDSQSQSQSQEPSQESTSKPKRKQRTKKSNTSSKQSSPGEVGVEMEMGENIIVQTPTAPVRRTRSSDVPAAGGDGSAQSTPDGAEKPKRGRGRPKKVK